MYYLRVKPGVLYLFLIMDHVYSIKYIATRTPSIHTKKYNAFFILIII